MTAPLLPRRRAGWRIFCFLFVLFPKPQKKSSAQEGEDGSARDPVSTLPSPSPFASGQQGPVRGRDAFSCAPCPAMEPGECRTPHSDLISGQTAGPLCSTSLPHRGYVGDSPGPACTVSLSLWAWLELPRPSCWLLSTIRPGYAIQFFGCPASSQVQGRSVHLSFEQGCPCLACRSRGPAGEGCDRAGPSSRD